MAPIEFITDFGSQFVNDLLSHFHHEMGIAHHATIPYSKEENGIVERATKEVNRHIRNGMFPGAVHNRTGTQQFGQTTTGGFTEYFTIW